MTGSVLFLAFLAMPLSASGHIGYHAAQASRQLNNVNNDVPGGDAE